MLQELLFSDAVQRLKGVHQGGASYLVNDLWNCSRYEHSVGVMGLIRRLGGSLEEQIAGLLHDVSHTAFSHVVDHVFDPAQEDYHEKIFEQVVLESTIPQILGRYGLDVAPLLFVDDLWSLLDRPLPALCADRIDYTLRDMLQHGVVGRADADRFLESLVVVDGEICTTSVEMAEWFVDAYYHEVIDYFLNPLNVYAYEMLARTLRIALERNVISTEDLRGTDEFVLEKIHRSADGEIQHLLAQLNRRVQVREGDALDHDIHQFKKLRWIDPMVVTNGRMERSSVLSYRVQQATARAMEKSGRGTFVKVLRQ